MWEALFKLLTAGLEFAGRLIPGKSKDTASDAASDDTNNSAAQRAGTVAGAAANTASHIERIIEAGYMLRVIIEALDFEPLA